MPRDDVFSVRVPADLADQIASFGVDAGLSRSASLVMLLSLGVKAAQSPTIQAALTARSRERTQR